MKEAKTHESSSAGGRQAPTVEDHRIRIRLRCYDHKILDESVGKIVATVRRTGGVIVGPVLLPTKRKLYTVLRSPHSDKKSREQFELRIHKRLIELKEPTPRTIDELMKLELAAGVDVEIKL
ncbi:MAG: 30S ribosomal protein S10 [Elusimicrobia bacterium]|nr:30S ribosomal protein S10 [Elusimicrobiota bacterium]